MRPTINQPANTPAGYAMSPQPQPINQTTGYAAAWHSYNQRKTAQQQRQAPAVPRLVVLEETDDLSGV